MAEHLICSPNNRLQQQARVLQFFIQVYLRPWLQRYGQHLVRISGVTAECQIGSDARCVRVNWAGLVCA